MSEELTLLQKLMTSKPPTRRITSRTLAFLALSPSKPPTRRITQFTPLVDVLLSSKPPTRRITCSGAVHSMMCTSKPPTRRITVCPARTDNRRTSKPPTRRITQRFLIVSPFFSACCINIPIKPFAFGASFQPPYSKRFFRTTFL